MKVLITGSGGLIGSEACVFFLEKDFEVYGIDNDMRSYFFGESASTKDSVSYLSDNFKYYHHVECDIRDKEPMLALFKQHTFDLIIHTAAQPSHDWAAKEPITDFEINALATLYLVEYTRLYNPEAVFIFTSTNKVYGNTPNNLRGLIELDTRYEVFKDNALYSIDETMSIDRSKHSIFGASKVAADIMVQEYGKYFGLKTGVFRGSCLTGEKHAGAELHGFLSYLVKCIVHNNHYDIFGYKGKQVRDNIYSWDLINMFWHFYQSPKAGEVYNAGGGRDNSTSILEAIDSINKMNDTFWSDYNILEDNRVGDHIWYISDLSKFKFDFPGWEITYSLEEVLDKMIWKEKNENNS